MADKNKYKTLDPVNDAVPGLSSGYDPCDNSGITPGEVADTPGEKATNDTAAESFSKAQPFKTKGSGYTS